MDGRASTERKPPEADASVRVRACSIFGMAPFYQRPHLTVHIALALIVYVASTTILCRKFGDNEYEQAKGLHKLAGAFVVLAAVGLALPGSHADMAQALSFQRLDPLTQYPIVAALIIWTYLGFLKIQGKSD